MEGNKKRIIIATVVGIVLLSCFVGSFRVINSGEVGIRVRLGKVISTQMNEGIKFKIPLVEKIVKMNIRVQKVEVEASSASKDMQDVKLRLAINYKVGADKATELYKTVGEKYKDIVLQPAIQESVKAVTSQYTAEELITNRSEVSKKCIEMLQGKIEKYGLQVEDFNITNFDFSQEFNKAIEEKQVAEQKVLTAKQELEKSKVEAERRIVEAEAEKKVNEMKQQSLTDNVIKEKFIAKWDGSLPTVVGGNGIFNINDFLQQ